MPQTPPVRLLIHGASGRMGEALLRLAGPGAGVEVVAAVSRHALAGSAGKSVWIAAGELAKAPEFDVAIDFSQPMALNSLVAFCVSRGTALVSGTTGIEGTQRRVLEDAAKSIPVLWAANFSLGIAVLSELVRRAAEALPGWDCDIIEAHHARKLDAPSGTALLLGEVVRAGRGQPPHYASVRAGDIVGEHTVMLSGAGERVELVHRASNRDIFAAGALEAGRRIAGRPAGSYALSGLLFTP